jgi:predicted lysophospholipase L1 biosynthesis ABC-type transport system permease subunit
VLVPVALVAVLLAGASGRGWEVSVLRLLGTPGRHVTRAAALEHFVLLMLGAVAGAAAGVLAAQLSLPELLAATTRPGEVPFDTAPAWTALGVFGAVVIAAVAVVSVVAALATTHATRLSRLREAQP